MILDTLLMDRWKFRTFDREWINNFNKKIVNNWGQKHLNIVDDSDDYEKNVIKILMGQLMTDSELVVM